MAEFVELRAEEWATELEQLEKMKLFSPKEAKAIATKRRQYEYKIQRKSKTKEDYLTFIQFEIDLMRLIKYRREQMKINSHHAMIEKSLTNRVVKLFKQAINKNKGDIKLWMSFFKYCSETNMHKLGSQMLVKMLKVHADQENLWSFAAKWDYESLNSPDTARQLLLKGIRYHPTSALLHSELFKLELSHATDKRKELEENPNNEGLKNSKNIDDVINLKLAEVVYNTSCAKIKHVDFKVDLLNFATEYPNTETLQDNILQDLLKEHTEEEITWDVMAKRKLMEMDKDSDIDKQENSMEVDSDESSKLTNRRAKIQAAVDTYEIAIKKFGTMKMWSFYLEFLFEIRGNKAETPVYKKKLLRNALLEALNAERIEEKYLLRWIKILPEVCPSVCKQSLVLRNATKLHPQSLDLWHARLRFHLLRNKEKTGEKIFKEATEKITGAESLPLWKLMIQFYQTRSNAKVEETFQTGIRLGGPISLCLKPLYLRWLALTKGVACAKSLFETPEMHHPPCVEVMNEMISLELMQPDTNKKFIRRCHEMACNAVGKNNLDVWISYIEFELSFGDGEGPFIIYMRAVKTLCAELVQEFVSRYNALKMGS